MAYCQVYGDGATCKTLNQTTIVVGKDTYTMRASVDHHSYLEQGQYKYQQEKSPAPVFGDGNLSEKCQSSFDTPSNKHYGLTCTVNKDLHFPPKGNGTRSPAQSPGVAGYKSFRVSSREGIHTIVVGVCWVCRVCRARVGIQVMPHIGFVGRG